MIRNATSDKNNILSPFSKYTSNTVKKTDSSPIIDFNVNRSRKKINIKEVILAAIDEIEEEEKKDRERANHFPDSSTRIQNQDGSYTDTIKYKNGSEKSTTLYKDGSYDEIYKSNGGLSYTRIKRFDNIEDYTEIYQDSSGFCGKETFVKLPDGTSISTNEYNNGKKYIETYKKNADGGFTRKLENNDGTGYTETQAYGKDGSSSYSVFNLDGSGNKITYNPDGSYVEILIDSNGNKTINKYDA